MQDSFETLVNNYRNDHWKHVIVSDHSIDRYREKISQAYKNKYIIKLLKYVFFNGTKIELDKVTRVKNLIKYHCQEATYYKFKNIVIVINGSDDEGQKPTSERVILTCYPYKDSKLFGK
jgi:glycosyltransferase involved in cell wall biosynthesis